MEEVILEKELTLRVNRIALSAELSVPKEARILVLLLLGEKDDHFWDRFSQLRETLNRYQIATCIVRDLLTGDERKISANRWDESLLADRLVAFTKQLQHHPDLGHLQIAYAGLSSMGGILFRAISLLAGNIESLVLIGNGLPSLNFIFCAIPILNIIGELDLKGRESNLSSLSKIEAPIKRFHLIPGSPSHFEEGPKWSLVREAILNWFSRPEQRYS